MGGRLRLVAALAVLFAIWFPALASADGAKERQFTDLVHRERAAAGVPAYAEKVDLADVARGQAERMAREQRLYHNPRLGDEVQNWDAVGENVGRGPSVEEIHRAFMDSPTHRSEILSTDFTEVGVGVAIAADGEIWVAQVFRKPTASSPPPQPAPTTTARPAPAPAPAPAPRPAPAPAPTTTAAPRPPVAQVAAAAQTVPPPPSTTTTTAPTAPQAAPAPELLAASAPPSSADPLRSVSAIRAATPGDDGLDPDVTTAVRIAATLLVLVVAAQTRYVAGQVGGVGLRPASSPRTRLAATAATLP